MDPIGLVVVSIDKEMQAGYVRSKLGLFKIKFEMNELFIPKHAHVWNTLSTTPSPTFSSEPPIFNNTHERFCSFATTATVQPSEDDVNLWRSVFDAYFQTARYSEEFLGDALNEAMADLSKCFAHRPAQHIVVDVHDTRDSDAGFSIGGVLGVPADELFPFEKPGQALREMGLTPKRPGDDEFKPPKRSMQDKVVKRNDLLQEIRDNEVSYEKNLGMMMLLHTSLQALAQTDQSPQTDDLRFFLNSCPRVEPFKKISAKFLQGLREKYFWESIPSPQIYMRLLLEYMDAFEPLIILAAPSIQTSLETLQNKLLPHTSFQTQLEPIYTLIHQQNNGPFQDIVTLLNLPLSRLQYLRNGVMTLLESTPVNHPQSSLYYSAAARIHTLSRKIESRLDELDSKAFMIKLGVAIDCSEVVSAHRVYLNDYAVKSGRLNCETSGGAGTRVMLLSDMVVVLARFVEKGGGVLYRVQRCVGMDEVVAVEREGCVVGFVFRCGRGVEKSMMVLRFECGDEVAGLVMFREVRHAWVVHGAGRCYSAASRERVPVFVAEREEGVIYFRVVKEVEGVEKGDVRFVCGNDGGKMQAVLDAVISKTAFCGAFAYPQTQTDFIFRTRSSPDTLTTSPPISQIHTLQDSNALTNALAQSAFTALHHLTSSPMTITAIQIRATHLLNVFYSFPRVSMLRKASFACKQFFSGRVRRQSTASLFSVDSCANSIHTVGESEEGDVERKGSCRASPERGGGGGVPRKVLQLGGVEFERRVRAHTQVSGQGGEGVGMPMHPGRVTGRRGCRGAGWFKKIGGSKREGRVVDFASLGDLELVQAICMEIELREEKRAYNYASVANENSSSSQLLTREYTLQILTRAKSATEFAYALRILLNSCHGDSTFSERFIMSSHMQHLLLRLTAGPFFQTLFAHLNRVSMNQTGTTSSVLDMAGFLASSLFPEAASKTSPSETRFLCVSILSLLIEHYNVIMDGESDFDVDDSMSLLAVKSSSGSVDSLVELSESSDITPRGKSVDNLAAMHSRTEVELEACEFEMEEDGCDISIEIDEPFVGVFGGEDFVRLEVLRLMRESDARYLLLSEEDSDVQASGAVEDDEAGISEFVDAVVDNVMMQLTSTTESEEGVGAESLEKPVLNEGFSESAGTLMVE
ncbi:hypothetical protein HDU98_007287 [Podochytrium sp. JEL0797]|nr:hypothetical protein HDU98_007287 [Podochytrium sp. JEL0797]